MFLIASGAYVSPEFVSEIGRLPPAFLPVGNKRLIEMQLNEVEGFKEDLYLSLPEDYQLDAADLELLKRKNVQIIRVPLGLSLAESILYCWNSTGVRYDSLKVLHGDTLIQGLNNAEDRDLLSISLNSGYYHRAIVAKNHDDSVLDISEGWAGDDEQVLSGFFSFSKPHVLVQSLVKSGGRFIEGLKRYSETVNLKAQDLGKWYDLGHINAYFQSRTAITTQRSFNDMKITSRVVSKSSEKVRKMQAEVEWFKSLPSDLKIYTPHLIRDTISEDVGAYSLEYLYLMPLNDLYVYGNLPSNVWKSIFVACKDVWVEMSKYRPSSFDEALVAKLYSDKTFSRLEEFSKQTGFDLNKPIRLKGAKSSGTLNEIARQSLARIPQNYREHISLIHGDYCFSNILYDSRVQSIKMIDPRGVDSEGKLTIYGDNRYDLAKLYHSVIGMYDYIIAGKYKLEYCADEGVIDLQFYIDNRVLEIQSEFRESIFKNSPIDEKVILSITVLLFLSMLPLHEDRPEGQLAMIANALRLYELLLNFELVELDAVI
jgi:hypothetical protein